jgi:hypothetical protein
MVFQPAENSQNDCGNRRSLHYASPDFLLRLVALASFMKAAYVVVSVAAWREIRVRSVEKHFHVRASTQRSLHCAALRSR